MLKKSFFSQGKGKEKKPKKEGEKKKGKSKKKGKQAQEKEESRSEAPQAEAPDAASAAAAAVSETKGTPPPPVKGHPEEVEDVAPVGDRVVVAILNFSTLIPHRAKTVPPTIVGIVRHRELCPSGERTLRLC